MLDLTVLLAPHFTCLLFVCEVNPTLWTHSTAVFSLTTPPSNRHLLPAVARGQGVVAGAAAAPAICLIVCGAPPPLLDQLTPLPPSTCRPLPAVARGQGVIAGAAAAPQPRGAGPPGLPAAQPQGQVRDQFLGNAKVPNKGSGPVCC